MLEVTVTYKEAGFKITEIYRIAMGEYLSPHLFVPAYSLSVPLVASSSSDEFPRSLCP